MSEDVILVDSLDRPQGVAGVARAHLAPGLLHRAFSVFIFNRSGELLLQRRSPEKRHFRGKWSNSCCGHARPGELLVPNAMRRVTEELGISTRLRIIASFLYTAADEETGLVEREYDWVLVGHFDGEPSLNPHEADAHAWVSLTDVHKRIASRPSDLTPWFPLALRTLMGHPSGSPIESRPLPNEGHRSGLAARNPLESAPASPSRETWPPSR